MLNGLAMESSLDRLEQWGNVFVVSEILSNSLKLFRVRRPPPLRKFVRAGSNPAFFGERSGRVHDSQNTSPTSIGVTNRWRGINGQR